MNKSRPSASRRQFLRQAALSAGAFTLVPRFVLGGPGYTAPSDKVNLAMIGCGRQSVGLGRRFSELDTVQFVASSDVYPEKMQRFNNMIEEAYAEASGMSSYQGMVGSPRYEDIINRDDVDAVIVALPDHWHAKVSVEAMEAGKDLFCEKPLTHTVNEGKLMVETARRLGTVVQTGSMQRSWDNFRKACELVRSGYIGEIEKVLVNVGDPAIPYNLAEETLPAGLDWDRWIGPAPMMAFNSRLAPAVPESLWPDWRLFEETGGGILCDWGAHMFDIAQWGLGMDDSGPVEFIPPEDLKAKRGMRFLYANGVEMVHEDFKRGWAVRFMGSEGIIDISRGFFETLPGDLTELELKDNDVHLYRNENHYIDWINCIKSREQPICDVEVGHRSASICNLANIAYKLGRHLKWDPAKETFQGDSEANALLGKDYRRGYALKGA